MESFKEKDAERIYSKLDKKLILNLSKTFIALSICPLLFYSTQKMISKNDKDSLEIRENYGDTYKKVDTLYQNILESKNLRVEDLNELRIEINKMMYLSKDEKLNKNLSELVNEFYELSRNYEKKDKVEIRKFFLESKMRLDLMVE